MKISPREGKRGGGEGINKFIYYLLGLDTTEDKLNT